jgi:membrane-associated phospholipid phosphatase
MAIEILKKIQSLDSVVENKFSGDLAVPPPKVDRFLKWLPVATVLLSDAEKTDRAGEMAKRLKVIALSETILNGLLLPLKKYVSRQRPDSSFHFDSFPSGHTATSFMGAEILNQAANNKALRLAGYAVAIATATIRVYKKKHWLSDVVAGAALGIASAKIANWWINRKAQTTTPHE